MGKLGRTALGIGSLYLGAGGFTTAFGWALGLQLLSGMGKQEQGKLTDLGVQTSEEGQPIPRGWGTWRQAGNLVWCPGLTPHKSGGGIGKGAPAVTEYTYTTSCYVQGGLGPITRINKIWANNKLLYDYNGGTEKGLKLVLSDDETYFYGDFDAELVFGTVKVSASSLRVYRGVQNQAIDPTMEAAKGVGHTPSYEYRWGVVVENLNLTPIGNSVPNFTFEVYNETVALTDIILEIAGWVGLTSDDFDLSALDDINVTGFIIDSRQTAASALSQLMDRYNFLMPEVDGVIRAVKKGGDSITTLTEKQYRVTTPDAQMPEVQLMERNETEIPEVTEVVTYDPSRRYHPGHRYGRRQVVDSKKKEVLTYNMAEAGNVMEQFARIRVHQNWTESEVYPLSLGLEHLYLSAGDVITIATSEGDKTVYLPNLAVPLFGPLTTNAPVSDALLYTAPLLDDTTPGIPPPQVPTVGPFSFIMADCNTLRLEDAQDAGFYVAATVPRNFSYNGVTLTCTTPGVLSSSSAGKVKAFKTPGIDLPYPATIGDVPTALPDHAGGSSDWDTDNTLRVQLIGGKDLASTTDAHVLNNGANAALVGSEANGWEVIQFVNATYIETLEDGVTKVWDLSRLKRGRRGSEIQIATHTDDEKFLLLDSAVERATVNPSAIGTEYTYEFAYTMLGQQVTTHDFTVSGNNLKPLPVKNITGSVNSIGQWAFSWQNVSRLFDLPSGLGGAPVDPVPPDLNQYEIEFLDGSDVVQGSYKVSMGQPVFGYKKSDQIDDFGSLQTSIKIRIYRMSATVGRGYPATAEFP